MKQLVFMAITGFLGTAGSFAFSPLYGIAVYYLYAVLRPQFIWDWVEFAGVPIKDVSWSFYVAVPTLVATGLWRLGLFSPSRVAAPPWYGNPGYTRTHYLFLMFTAWISLTYLTAVNQTHAWPFFLEYIKIFVMFICATFVLRTVQDLWVIYLVVVGATIYIGYEINMFYLSSGWLILSSKGYGGLDNNGAALMLAMAVPMCYFAWEAIHYWFRWGFLLVIPVLLHAILLSYSRGAMVSLVVSAIFVWFRARNKGFLTSVYVGLAILVLMMAGKEVRERFLSIGEHDIDASANARKVTWAIAIKMTNEKPIFGWGIRNSNLYTFDYGADIPGRSIHSQYLQTAADSGWVALALYLALLGSVFLGLRRTRRALRSYKDPQTDRVRSLASGVEAGLVLFCFGSIFLSLEHFEMPYILILLAVQLHAITRAVEARLAPPQPGWPAGRGAPRPSPNPPAPPGNEAQGFHPAVATP